MCVCQLHSESNISLLPTVVVCTFMHVIPQHTAKYLPYLVWLLYVGIRLNTSVHLAPKYRIINPWGGTLFSGSHNWILYMFMCACGVFCLHQTFHFCILHEFIIKISFYVCMADISLSPIIFCINWKLMFF